ncbi:MAG: polysaccharide pyruvyl transferase family protein [Rugosibacter sp.]
MNRKNTIIYGAEAVAQPPWPWGKSLKFEIKASIHSLIDQWQCHHGKVTRLDYRHYRGSGCINWGDVAISQSVTAFIAATTDAPVCSLNWGTLESGNKSPLSPGASVIFAGSGYFFLQNDNRLAPRIKTDLHALEEHGAQAIFFGVGLNEPSIDVPSGNTSIQPDDERLIRRMLDNAVGISVRDTRTQMVLESLTAKPVSLVGDPALHFHSLMNLKLSAALQIPNARPAVGLNIAFHGVEPNVLLWKNFDAYVTTLKKLQHATGCEFHYFIHFGTEKILPKLLAARGIHTKIHAGDSLVLAKGYSGLDLHIGGMLHSCILASSADVPCIGLAYDIKHQGFFDLLGFPKNCLAAADFDPDALYALAINLLANQSLVRQQIAARREELQAETVRFINTQLMALEASASAAQ